MLDHQKVQQILRLRNEGLSLRQIQSATHCSLEKPYAVTSIIPNEDCKSDLLNREAARWIDLNKMF